MRSDWTISACGHAAVLVFGLVSLVSSKPSEDASNFMPIAIVTSDNLSQAPAGQQNARKVEKPKPLVDKVAEPKPVKQLAPKVADKPEITTEAKPEPKPEAKPEPKPEPKPPQKTEKPKEPQVKPDRIAEELKKDEGKKPPKPQKKEPEFKPDQIAEELRRDEEKKARQSPKFDANQVAELLDHRAPQRQVATADKVNDMPNLGAIDGHAAQLSQSELDALRARLSQCWNPPVGVDASSNLYVVLHVLFKPDGSLAGEPAVVEGSSSALGPPLADSAKRALLLCQPFTMLKHEHYDLWKDIEVKFDPREMLGG